MSALFPGNRDDETNALLNPLIDELSEEMARCVNGYLHRRGVQGPPWVSDGPLFPLIEHINHLFQTGKLQSTGHWPDENSARAMSICDWAGLEIAEGGDRRKYAVWRKGNVRNASFGDFETSEFRAS